MSEVRKYANGGPVRGAMVLGRAPGGYIPPVRQASLSGGCHSRYYAETTRLDHLVADPSADINKVVREVERLCDREAHAAAYYRKHPELLYGGHPWLGFVDSGGAAHLGWHADLPGYREEWRP